MNFYARTRTHRVSGRSLVPANFSLQCIANRWCLLVHAGPCSADAVAVQDSVLTAAAVALSVGRLERTGAPDGRSGWLSSSPPGTPEGQSGQPLHARGELETRAAVKIGQPPPLARLRRVGDRGRGTGARALVDGRSGHWEATTATPETGLAVALAPRAWRRVDAGVATQKEAERRRMGGGTLDMG